MNEESGEIKQLFVYEHDAGRLELLVRILYWIVIGIVLVVYRFITGYFRPISFLFSCSWTPRPRLPSEVRIELAHAVRADVVRELGVGVIHDVSLQPLPRALVIPNLLAGSADRKQTPQVLDVPEG